MSTIMAIESRSRLPAWSYLVLACVGSALGLWQVGFFDRQAGKERGAWGGAVTGHVGVERSNAEVVPLQSSPGLVAGGSDPAAEIAAVDNYPLGDDLDVEALAETAALQAAMTAEQTNDR